MSESYAAIILAAGKGTRMRSKTSNKVVSKLANQPLISYTVKNLVQGGINSIIVVVGFAAPSVKQALGNRVTYCYQSKRLGTGHAVKTCLPQLSSQVHTLITMYGDDSAFYPPSLYTGLIKAHQLAQAAVSVVTVKVTNPAGLGRIIRDDLGNITAIVEEKVATATEKNINEINTGLFCFNRSYLEKAIKKIRKNPISREYYLTDIINIARLDQVKINPYLWPDASIWQGVNTPAELALAHQRMLNT